MNKLIKKILTVFICALLCTLLMFAGCSAEQKSEEERYAVGENMLSVAKVYCEFVETKTYMVGFGRYEEVSDVALRAGSAVIWSVDDVAGGWTYLVTNYHVVYDAKADTDKNGGRIARKINIYLYGSEGVPEEKSEKDENGYKQCEYGSYAINCEYVGGSIEADIAVIRTQTSTIKAVNKNIKPVTLAERYTVGQSAIAIGNPENEGISVTRGIISVENEYITLRIDGTARYYRSIRIDTALYSGNSGGGLFDIDGKLIGITNAGDSEDQNINFAIPLDIVKGTVNNILYYYDGTQPSSVKKILLGIEVKPFNSVYVYDAETGYGKICEDVVVSSVIDGSIAQQLQLAEGDIIKAISIGGNEYKVERSFNIADIILNVREGNKLTVKYVRDGRESATQKYEVKASDLSNNN